MVKLASVSVTPVKSALLRFFVVKFQPDRLMPTKPFPVSSPAARIRIGTCTLGAVIGKLVGNVKRMNLWLLLRVLEFRL